MEPALIGLELPEIQELLGPGQPPYRARQLYHALYHQRVQSIDQITALPASVRAELAGRFRLGLLQAERTFTSKDGTRRYLLRLADGKTVETVLMPDGARHTVCISTQAGCPVGCKFCLTAQLGLERNLTAGEIVAQVFFAAADAGLDPRDRKLNVVMMGQGEPLLNLANVLKATRLLADPDGFGLSQKRLTLSTAGIIPAIAELARAPVRPKLAISLNASTEEQRQAVMPLSRKYPLQDLLEACHAYPLRRWEKLTFEYVLLQGVNDSDADARRLVRLLARLNCKLNLIPLNPGPGLSFQPPDPERVLAFQRIVRRSLPCFIRKPRGLDIYAACGQLKSIASVAPIK